MTDRLLTILAICITACGCGLMFYGLMRTREFGCWSIVIAVLGMAAIWGGIFLYDPS